MKNNEWDIISQTVAVFVDDKGNPTLVATINRNLDLVEDIVSQHAGEPLEFESWSTPDTSKYSTKIPGFSTGDHKKSLFWGNKKLMIAGVM